MVGALPSSLPRLGVGTLVVFGTGCAGLLDLDEDRTLSYRDTVLNDGPVAYYRMEEAQGALTSSVVGAPPIQGQSLGYRASGATGHGIELDGSTSRAALGDSFDFVGQAALSLEIWVAFEEQDGFRQIVHKGSGDGSSAQGYSINVNNQDLLEFSRVRDGDYRNAKTPLRPEWIGSYAHVVATFDGAESRLYVNGTLQVQNDAAGVSLTDNDAPLTLGAYSGATGGNFSGRLDEFAIYDRVLSPEQVSRHYELGQ